MILYFFCPCETFLHFCVVVPRKEAPSFCCFFFLNCSLCFTILKFQNCLVTAVGSGASFAGTIVPLMILITVLFFNNAPCLVKKKMVKDIYTEKERQKALCHLATHLLLVQWSTFDFPSWYFRICLNSFSPSSILFCASLPFPPFATRAPQYFFSCLFTPSYVPLIFYLNPVYLLLLYLIKSYWEYERNLL